MHADRDDRTGSTRVSREPHDHPHLIDAHEDRWAWRAKIRANPTQLFFYRVAVGIAGLLLMIAAGLTGPLPGPGGIPLFLLGLAVWASEFEWAQNVMLWFKDFFRRYQGWRWPKKLLFWACFAACCWLLGYLTMLVFGVPPWLPEFARRWLAYLPGL
ncbi:PGPGW domain-containing protein [Mariniluteicoccus flavus]